MQDLTVMIVENSAVERFILQKHLEKFSKNIRVIEMSNGAEAIEFLTDTKNIWQQLPDIVFLDATTPVVDAASFLVAFDHHHMQFGKRMSIILMSDNQITERIDAALQSHSVCRFLQKPIQQDDLKYLFGDSDNRYLIA